MHTTLKATIASVLSLAILVLPGLTDALNDAGGPDAVAAAVVTLNVLIHGVIHHFTGGTPNA